jgi:hypothetical protein
MKAKFVLRSMLNTVAIFVITTVHHVYGAYLYNSPWRIHAVLVSGVSTVVIAGSLWLFRRYSTAAVGQFAFWSFVVLTVLVPVLGFGMFEGVYNHGLKDALYLINAPRSLMQRLFPAPMYEMPNNYFFEITGLLQIVPGFLAGRYLYRTVCEDAGASGSRPGQVSAVSH